MTGYVLNFEKTRLKNTRRFDDDSVAKNHEFLANERITSIKLKAIFIRKNLTQKFRIANKCTVDTSNFECDYTRYTSQSVSMERMKKDIYKLIFLEKIVVFH